MPIAVFSFFSFAISKCLTQCPPMSLLRLFFFFGESHLFVSSFSILPFFFFFFSRFSFLSFFVFDCLQLSHSQNQRHIETMSAMLLFVFVRFSFSIFSISVFKLFKSSFSWSNSM